MVLLETELTPAEMLGYLHVIEGERGRARSLRWGPRTLDLDIVRFGDRHFHEPRLTVPHPELQQRAFWLREIAELDQTPSLHE
jgi:2-amino-4-hydroxy-6-hydroxymethyldihydropteridine diphosphokinase